MAAKFVLKKTPKGFHWNLLGTNGRVIATSESYTSKAAAKTGIESVRRNAAGAELVDESPTRSSSTGSTATTTKRTAAKARPKKS